MGRRALFLVMACLVLLISLETAYVVGDTNGKDDKGVKEKDGKGVKETDNNKALKEKDDAKAQKEKDDKAKKEQEAKAKKEKEDAKAKKDAGAKAKKEAEAKAKKEKEDAKAKKDAEAKAKKEAEAKAKKEKKDAKAKKDAEAKAKKEAEAKAKAKKDAEAKAKKEAEAKAKQGKEDAKATTQYTALAPRKGSNCERAYCQAKGRCNKKTLECPKQCPDRKPKDKKAKGCFVDCSSKCETSCRSRKPSCEGYGSVCYDPRFVGDGRMFYFHGSKGGDFALFSDDDLQINAHFIGTRPEGRTRDYTWVQALSAIFDSHTLVAAAKRVSQWDDNVDALIIRWDGNTVEVPFDGEAEWRMITELGREVAVERTDDKNSVKVIVSGLLEVNVKVTPIGAEENRVHNYQLPSDDAFAHLETEFKFVKLTDMAEGVLGQTYRPDYVSPVKTGVAMPMMGGEDKYRTPSLLSPACKLCRFKGLQYAITTKAIEY